MKRFFYSNKLENISSKIIIDENLSRRLLLTMNNIFPESTHVGLENLLVVKDVTIWNFAREKGYCILTKDWDYKFLSVTFERNIWMPT